MQLKKGLAHDRTNRKPKKEKMSDTFRKLSKLHDFVSRQELLPKAAKRKLIARKGNMSDEIDVSTDCPWLRSAWLVDAISWSSVAADE